MKSFINKILAHAIVGSIALAVLLAPALIAEYILHVLGY